VVEIPLSQRGIIKGGLIMIEYINLLTGEVITATSKWRAYRIFKATAPRKYTKWRKVITMERFYLENYGF
jgi:hypothetical protein